MPARRELATAAWGAGAFGAVLASYGAFRPVRDALVLDGDPEQIPWLFTASFVATTAVSPLWSAALARANPRTKFRSSGIARDRELAVLAAWKAR